MAFSRFSIRSVVAFCLLAASLSSVPLCAQTPPPSSPKQEGSMTIWDIKEIAEILKAHTDEFKPLIERVNPKLWTNQDAAQAYQSQWEYCRNEIGYMNDSTAKFVRQTDKLPAGLEAYFRLESLNAALRSFIEGIRRVYNPAVAELLEPNVAKLTEDQQALGKYILSLAQQREDEFQAMDREAQRCRSMLTRPGAKK
jgi:hypothetical protein